MEEAKDVGVGAAATITCGALVAGVQGTLQLLFMAFACTAGLALLPFGFACFLIGRAVRKLWEDARGPAAVAPTPEVPPGPPADALTAEQAALLEFIYRARSAGRGEEEILAASLRAGWDEAAVRGLMA